MPGGPRGRDIDRADILDRQPLSELERGPHARLSGILDRPKLHSDLWSQKVVGQRLERELTGDLLEQAVTTLERRFGSRHSFRGEFGGEYALSARERGGCPLPNRKITGARRAQRYVDRSNGDGIGDGLRRQPQQVAMRSGAADPDGKSLIPSQLAKPGRDGQANDHFICDNERGQHLLAALFHRRSDRQDSAERVARMTAMNRVVEIEIAYHCGVDEGCILGGGPLAESEDTTAIGPRLRRCRDSPADARRIAIVAADGASQAVHQALLGGMRNVRRDLFEA